jgi:hypothetical protein
MSCCYVPYSRPIEHAPAKRRRNSTESVLLDVCQEKVVLVGKPFVVAAYFLYHAVCAHAKRTLRIVIAQASLEKRESRE